MGAQICRIANLENEGGLRSEQQEVESEVGKSCRPDQSTVYPQTLNLINSSVTRVSNGETSRRETSKYTPGVDRIRK